MKPTAAAVLEKSSKHVIPVWISTLERVKENIPQLRSYVNWEVGLGSHSLSHSFPVPNNPYGFCGRQAP